MTLAVLPSRAFGGELSVVPILVELGAAKQSALVTLANAGAEPSRYEVRAYAWAQDEAGQMKLEPTAELVIFPPLLELGPGEERNLRIGFTGAPAASERSFRVFVEELPPPQSEIKATAVRVLTRVGLPVFVSPAEQKVHVELALEAADGRARLAVRNGGTVRLRPASIQLTGHASDGAATFELALDPWYVLAGEVRRYEAAVPPEACRRTRELRATVELEPNPIVTTIPLRDGACAP